MHEHLVYFLSSPEWEAAIATWALFAVTALAAIFGVPAAIAAARTYRLEAEPVVVIRQLDREEEAPHDPSHLLPSFTIDGMPLLKDGVELREYRPSDSAHPNMRSAANKSVVLELHNAGRSPALAVDIPFNLSVPMFLEKKDATSGMPQVGTQHGRGHIALPAIDANGSSFVLLTNLVGNQVKLEARQYGEYSSVDGKSRRRRPLGIVSVQDITIAGP